MRASRLLNILLKYTLQFYTNLYQKCTTGVNWNFLLKYFFSSRIWTYFKFQHLKSFGVYTNTLLLSILYWKYKQLIFTFITPNTPIQLTNASVYIKSVPILYFSFHKTKYNSFIVLLLKIFVDYYHTTKINFNLAYGFLFFQSNFFFYNFVNKYYFQPRNY
jgi:hypothetical protein